MWVSVCSLLVYALVIPLHYILNTLLDVHSLVYCPQYFPHLYALCSIIHRKFLIVLVISLLLIDSHICESVGVWPLRSFAAYRVMSRLIMVDLRSFIIVFCLIALYAVACVKLESLLLGD